MFLPISIDFTGKKVLIVGGGTIALKRAKSLTAAGAEITLLAPKREHEKEWSVLPICYRPESYTNQLLQEYFLVVAATDDAGVNRGIATDCREKGILCNQTGQGLNGDLIFPGVVNCGGYTAALSSNGRTPFLTRHLCEKIEALLAPYDEEFVVLLAAVRRELIEKYPEEKETLLKKLAQVPVEEIKEKGDSHDICNWLQRK